MAITELLQAAAASITVLAGLAGAVIWVWAMERKSPKVELIENIDEGGKRNWRLRISNPTHRPITLERIETTGRHTETDRFIRRDDDVHTAVHLAFDEKNLVETKAGGKSRKVHRAQPVFQRVQSHGTKDVDVERQNYEAEIDWKIHWESGIPIPEKWFATKRLRLTHEEVMAKRLEATK